MPYGERAQWVYDGCGATLHGFLYAFGETLMVRKFPGLAVQIFFYETRPLRFECLILSLKSLQRRHTLRCFYAIWNYYHFTGDSMRLDELTVQSDSQRSPYSHLP